jgi:hypothetical protein
MGGGSAIEQTAKNTQRMAEATDDILSEMEDLNEGMAFA